MQRILAAEIFEAPAPAPAGRLAAALDWLRDLLLWHIARTRHTYGALADDVYRGLYVPRAEVDIIAADPGLPPDLAAEHARLMAQRPVDADSPLDRLAALFDLGPFERDVLLLALAPELDLRFERIYAYIQDDVSRRRPSVDLALSLFCPAPADRLERQSAFEPDAPLLRERLLTLFEDGQRRAPLLSRFIKLDDRIAAELRGGYAAIDPAISSFTRLERPSRRIADLVLPEELADRLRRNIAPGALLALQGSYGSGRRAIVEALCDERALPLLSVDVAQLAALDLTLPGAPSPAELLQRTLREALLRGAALCWHAADAVLCTPEPGAWQRPLLDALDSYPGVGFLTLEQPWESRGALRRTRFLRVELPQLSYTGREQIWRQRLGADAPDDATLQALASTFRLSGGQIRDAAAMARALAHWRGDAETLPVADLFAACRAQSSGRLDALAHKIRTTYSWNDIVLPPDQVAQLREICVQVRHRRTVLERWGFDRHLAMGKGVNALFAGQSGTGKTMAAEIIAADLGLELYKVDLSSMVSKYIGETEKNLDRIFTAAREANAILFFDEADAIFGKRSEVKDAHDRYANIEVGYLLQKMEEYDGVVILATNLRKNLDEAFVRRLHVAIEFPFPEEPDRLRIWQKVFPREAPLAEDVDLEFLARQFKLPGGNIRNVALLSAFLAAEAGETIEMVHVIRSIRREYQKIGKLVTAAEFERYLSIAKS
jgi:hypothetical protein